MHDSPFRCFQQAATGGGEPENTTTTGSSSSSTPQPEPPAPTVTTAAASTSSPGVEDGPLWQVPWDVFETLRTVGLIWVANQAIPAILLSLAARAQGLEISELPSTEKVGAERRGLRAAPTCTHPTFHSLWDWHARPTDSKHHNLHRRS